MKIGVISPKIGWGTQQLLKAGEKFGSTVHIPIQEIGYNFSHSNEIFSFDAFILKGVNQSDVSLFALEYLYFLEKRGVLFNPISSILNASNKITTSLMLNANKLRIFDSILTMNLEEGIEFLKRHETVLAKPIYGKGGEDIILVSVLDDHYQNVLKDFLRKFSVLYLQKFFSDLKRDIRVFVIGDRVQGAMYREKRGTGWLTNISAGGKPKFCPLDEKIVEISVEASKLLNLEFSGIDLMPLGKGEYVILEINGCPGWWGLSQVTSENIAEKIVEHVVTKVSC